MAEEVIIDLKIDDKQATDAIIEARKAIEELTQEKEKLTKAEGDHTAEVEKLNAAIKVEQQAIRANQKVLQDNIKQTKQSGDSLNAMRAKLNNMIKDYDNLSKSQRENESVGGALLKSIQEQTKQVSELEQATGRSQRAVGSYEEAIKKAFGGTSIGKAMGGISQFVSGFRNIGSSANAVEGGVQKVDKGMLKLAMNPIIAIIGAIVVVFRKLVDAFKKNDDAGTAMQSMFSAFKPILDVMQKGLQAIVSVIGKVADGISKFVRGIMQAIPSLREFSNAEEDLVRSTDKLQDTEREYTVAHAKRERDVAELTNKSKESEKYSYKEREGFVKNAIELERQDLIARQTIAKEKLRLAKLEAKVNSDTSDETKNKIAELEAEVVRAEQEFQQGTRRLNSQLNSFQAEERRSRQEAARQAAADRKERRQKELEETRRTQDILLAIAEESFATQRRQTNLNYDRQIEDLKNRLNEEKNLTVKAKKEINEQMILLDAKRQIDLGKIQLDEVMKSLQTEYELAEARAKANAQSLDAQRQVIIAKYTQLSEELKQRTDISDQQMLTLQKGLMAERTAELYDLEKTYAEERIAKMYDIEITNALDTARMKMELKKQELDTIAQYEDESDEQFLERKAKVNKEYLDAQRNYANAELEIQKTKANGLASIFGNVASIMETMAGENEALVKASKMVALAEVAIKQGVAIAEAVASAAGGDPYTYAIRVALAIASTVTAMTQAIASINSAKFATGGVIRGEGNGTSDSIIARVSNGESVINAKSTAKYYDLLSAINQDGGGIAFDGAYRNHFANGGMVNIDALQSSGNIDAMQRVVLQAVQNIQPVVSVKEITNVQKRVATKETIARQ